MRSSFFIFFISLSLLAKSQSEALQKEMNFVFEEARAQGFEHVRSDSSLISEKKDLRINPDTFDKEGIYYWAVFTEQCNSCEIDLFYQKELNHTKSRLEPTVKKTDFIQRLEFSFAKEAKTQNHLSISTTTEKKIMIYSLVFWKSTTKP